MNTVIMCVAIFLNIGDTKPVAFDCSAVTYVQYEDAQAMCRWEPVRLCEEVWKPWFTAKDKRGKSHLYPAYVVFEYTINDILP